MRIEVKGPERLVSPIYGDLGRLKAIPQTNAFRLPLSVNESGRIRILGYGDIGGKGEGQLFLDKFADKLKFKLPQTAIIIANGFFGLPPLKIGEGHGQQIRIEAPKIATIRALLEDESSESFAFRSSAPGEDSANHTAAGIFETIFKQDYHAESAITAVLGSSYTAAASAFYRRRGFKDIPPMAILINSPVGTKHPGDVFFPQMSGIINGATPGKINMTTTWGFAFGAVGPSGTGIVETFDLAGKQVDRRGEFPELFYFLSLGTSYTHLKRDLHEESIGGQSLYEYLEAAFKSAKSARKKLVQAALSLQNEAGRPLDLEFAIDNKTSYLYQARPVRPKQAIIDKPKTSPLLDSTEVIGQGIKKIRHVIIMKSSSSKGNWAAISEELSRKYEDALLMLSIDHFPQLINRDRNFLPYNAWADASGIIIVEEMAGHEFGSGLQHMALNARDEEAIFMLLGRSRVGRLEENLPKLGKKVYSKKAKGLAEPDVVWKLARHLALAADDENGWGLVYDPK